MGGSNVCMRVWVGGGLRSEFGPLRVKLEQNEIQNNTPKITQNLNNSNKNTNKALKRKSE